MTIHHLAIWTFRLEELKHSIPPILKGKVMKSILILKRDSSLILFLLTEVLLWS